MKVIGITGGTGSGKSTIAAELKALGAEVIDADKISRQVTAKGGVAFDEIIRSFGEGVLAENGEIDRKKLGGIVFSDSRKLELLESITHKHIFDKMKKQLDSCKAEVAVLDVPLLFSSDFPFKCDLTVAVVADCEVRIKRIMERDGITREAALLRINNQLSDDEMKSLANICFANNGDFEELRKFVAELYYNM